VVKISSSHLILCCTQCWTQIEVVTVGKKPQACEFCVANEKGLPSRNGKEKLARCVAYGGKLRGRSGDFC